MREINVAILGSWAFHATEFVQRNQQVPGCHMTVAWDSDPVKGKKWAESMGLSFEEDYHRILEDPNIDGVMITSATEDHAEMSMKAAEAGKAIFVEKAPMLTGESAEAVREAVKKNGVLYVVSDPLVKPEAYQLKKMMEEDVFGRITLIHIRNAHAMALEEKLPEYFFRKEESGGGVTLDVGCHGIHMLWWFLGMPVSCVSVFSYMTQQAAQNRIEDNAAVSYLFENGAIGIAESSWTAQGDQADIEVFGTKGCAHAFGGRIFYCCGDKEWHVIEKTELPPAGMKPMDQWLDTLINGTEHTEYHIDEAVAMTKMMEAAYQASEKNLKL